MAAETAEQRERRDACILEHVALYRLTLAAVVQRLFFPEEHYPDRDEAKKRAGDTLSALCRQQKLRAHKFPGGLAYYTLRHAKPANTQAIDFDLATLWICCLDKNRSYRLETAEVRRLFETPPHHHLRHCLTPEDDGPVIYRIYPTTVDVKTTISYLKKHIVDARNRRGLADWIDLGDYGFWVATETEAKAEKLAEALRHTTSTRPALVDGARLVVSVVPTSESLGRYLT